MKIFIQNFRRRKLSFEGHPLILKSGRKSPAYDSDKSPFIQDSQARLPSTIAGWLRSLCYPIKACIPLFLLSISYLLEVLAKRSNHITILS